MIQRIVKRAFSEGTVVGSTRAALAALCVAALINGVRGGDALAGPIMALVFISSYALALRDWREAAIIVFAPDRMLSDLQVSLGWRIAFTVLRLIGAGIFWTFLTLGLMPAGGLLAMVPLGASALQRLCTRAGFRWS
jgi:hypothetical protein